MADYKTVIKYNLLFLNMKILVPMMFLFSLYNNKDGEEVFFILPIIVSLLLVMTLTGNKETMKLQLSLPISRIDLGKGLFYTINIIILIFVTIEILTVLILMPRSIVNVIMFYTPALIFSSNIMMLLKKKLFNPAVSGFTLLFFLTITIVTTIIGVMDLPVNTLSIILIIILPITSLFLNRRHLVNISKKEIMDA